MKILFLTRYFWPHAGGVEKHVFEVSKRLIKQGHEITVVSEEVLEAVHLGGVMASASLQPATPEVGSRAETLQLTLQGQGLSFRTYRIPVGNNDKLKKWRIWWWLFKNRKLIKEADLVHAHDVGFWYWPFRFLYPRKPFFITFHGWEEKFPIPWKNKFTRKISEKLAKGNICIGDYLQKWYGTRADIVSYGGVEILPPRGSTSHTPEVSLPQGVHKIVFIGRLDEQSGIMIYLKALKILRKNGRKFHLVICGDGWLRSKAEKYIRENNLPAKILGFIPETRKYLQTARFVFASGYLAILEAMADRKLVFSVYGNLLKEDYLKLTPFSKWIVSSSFPDTLYSKLVHYLDRPDEEKKLLDEAYQWVKSQTWEKVTGIYLDLWGD